MWAKTSRKMMIKRRVTRLRKRVGVNTQQIRVKTLDSLQEIFDLAASLAKGEFKTQSVDGVPVKVTMKQRQLWARVAAYTAQIMNSVASGFDEREIDVQLDELERLVDEAKTKAKARKTKKRAEEADTAKASEE